MKVDLQIPWKYDNRFTDLMKLWQSIYRSHETITVDLQIPLNYDSRFTDPMKVWQSIYRSHETMTVDLQIPCMTIANWITHEKEKIFWRKNILKRVANAKVNSLRNSLK